MEHYAVSNNKEIRICGDGQKESFVLCFRVCVLVS